ncbi:ribose ABC transporter substrate-binding protein [Vallitalea longa]|uniref:Ribose ABC transporter substrate-binding protein n=1 Tax=Vallitalea longa TaxID=2936439 RepID=A0A9W5Y8A5_9FIRM|nr:substrate-binding domain-containing protein [Vallitalea longa]GKX27671.1 ribose ABC transporter substrate-binding protein [Vallitalea longa]
MNKKILSLMLTLIMVVSLVIGCSKENKSEVTESSAKVSKDLTFVVVPKCVHPWFDEVNKGAQAQAKALSEQLGVKVTVNYRAPVTADVAEQNTVLEQAAATRPDGIALDPLDYEGNKAVIEEIQKQGIPVVLFDASAPAGSGLTSVGIDFTEQATMASDKLAELIGEEGKVAVMQGVPTAPNHAERYQAHLDALAKYPNIEVIEGGIDNDSVEEAQSQAAAVLAANPDLEGYLNCDGGAAGIAAAVEEAGKTDQVTIVSIANLIDILKYVKKGTITGTSSSIPQLQGSMSVLMLWQVSIGLDIPKVIDTGIVYIDSENVDEWIKIVEN